MQDVIPIAAPTLGIEEQRAVADVLASGMLSSGPRTVLFEEAFAKFCQSRHAVATCNGTAALHTALLACGVGPGDEVVTTPFTFVATANAILLAGARPVFADIDPVSFTLDPDAVAERIGPKTKAVLPVHLYGHPADMASLGKVANAAGAKLVEDACQAHGAEFRGRPVGSLGDVAVFSFYPTKNMTMGEGGAITTNDDSVAAFCRSFRNHGRPPQGGMGSYDHVQLGHNYRTTDIQAAIGLVQLGRLPELNARRRMHARYLIQQLGDVAALPQERTGCEHSYHLFTLRVAEREAVMRHLREQGIGSGIYYPKVLYEHPHLRAFADHCPEAERASQEVLSVPIHPGLSEKDLERVAFGVRSALQRSSS